MHQSESTEAARDVERLAGDKRRFRGCQENDGRCNVDRLSDAAQRRGGFSLFAITLEGASAQTRSGWGKWPGLHYMVRELDGDKFVEEVEWAVARLSDGAGGIVPFRVR